MDDQLDQLRLLIWAQCSPSFLIIKTLPPRVLDITCVRAMHPWKASSCAAPWHIHQVAQEDRREDCPRHEHKSARQEALTARHTYDRPGAQSG
jgi:hypothetical protein